MVNADSSVLFFILAALFALHGEGSCGFELRPSSVSLLTLPGGGSCGVELCPSSVSESITKPLRDEEAAILLCFFVSGDWQPPVQVAYGTSTLFLALRVL